jgi:hypothetical protein
VPSAAPPRARQASNPIVDLSNVPARIVFALFGLVKNNTEGGDYSVNSVAMLILSNQILAVKKRPAQLHQHSELRVI